MKKFTYLTILFVFLCVFANAQQNGTFNTIAKERPADYENLSAPDSLGMRRPLKMPSQSKSTGIHLPYPIIFIHGLNSNSDTWNTTTNFMDSQYGTTYGGRFDYCLNYDSDNSTANTNFYPTAGADIAVFSGTWILGDYYYVNFDVGNDGGYNPGALASNQVWSDQSAIVKQGLALRDAIYRVLQLTGRDKVVLIGHSMGGLAAREYLQNPSNWQPDGQSHVAKLVTTGTPHGGSNATSFGVVSSNTNGQSEAVRDLRRTYYYSGNQGVYLFGGLEDLSYMNDQACCYFYNPDVNCNGITEENVVGLNQKSIYTNLDYSCIIGECSGCIGTTNPGDGVVWDVCADLNNYYTNITTNLFYYYASAVTEIHTDLPSQYYQNMQGLDEPEYCNLAYHIGFNTTYMGFLTVPASNDPNSPKDVDDYKFSVPTNSNVTVSVNNIIIALDFWVNILNSSYQVVGSAFHASGSTQSIYFTSTLNAGDYYLQIYAVPDANSYLAPYNFTLTQTTINSVIDLSKKLDNILIYPNPATDNLTIVAPQKSEIEILNIEGQIIKDISATENQTAIDISDFANGVYVVEVKTEKGIEVRKFVKE